MDTRGTSDYGRKSYRQQDIKDDINVMLWSMDLYKVRRFSQDRFWQSETRDAEYAARIEPFPRLEGVAEHSWHVADTVLLLGGHFPSLNLGRCLRLAILHDKMEMLIGDSSLTNQDSSSELVRACEGDQHPRSTIAVSTINRYKSRLRSSVRSEQGNDLLE